MEQNQENQERLYKPSEVAKKLAISTDLLRKWSDEFNVAVETTDGGHRRYSKENVELLIAISKKIKEQNWSWDQVKAWRNGEVELFTSHEERSNLDKKMDELIEMNTEMQNQLQKQEQFNLELLKRLEQQQKYMEERLLAHDKLLMQNMTESLETRRLIATSQEQEQNQEKKKGFFAKLFGK